MKEPKWFQEFRNNDFHELKEFVESNREFAKTNRRWLILIFAGIIGVALQRIFMG